MTSHETKKVLRPKNHNDFEQARLEYDRRWSIVADWRITCWNPVPTRTVPDRIFRAAERERRSIRQADYRRKSPNSENYKKYKVFNITTKVVEHRSHTD